MAGQNEEYLNVLNKFIHVGMLFRSNGFYDRKYYIVTKKTAKCIYGKELITHYGFVNSIYSVTLSKPDDITYNRNDKRFFLTRIRATNFASYSNNPGLYKFETHYNMGASL
jgi:hypothetical protein